MKMSTKLFTVLKQVKQIVGISSIIFSKLNSIQLKIKITNTMT